MNEEANDRLSVPEAAALLGIAEQTLRNWVDAGRVRHIRLPSGQLRFLRSDIEAILTPVEPTNHGRAAS